MWDCWVPVDPAPKVVAGQMRGGRAEARFRRVLGVGRWPVPLVADERGDATDNDEDDQHAILHGEAKPLPYFHPECPPVGAKRSFWGAFRMMVQAHHQESSRTDAKTEDVRKKPDRCSKEEEQG